MNAAQIPVFNLDGASDEELESYRATLRTICDYISLTLNARTRRRAGMVAPALVLEARADEAYKRLPKEVQW